MRDSSRYLGRERDLGRCTRWVLSWREHLAFLWWYLAFFRFLILEAYLVFCMFIIAEAFDIPYFYHAVLYQQLYSYIMELANLRTKLLFINNEYQKY